VGRAGILYPPHLKKWEGHVPSVPHQIAPMSPDTWRQLSDKIFNILRNVLESLLFLQQKIRHGWLLKQCHWCISSTRKHERPATTVEMLKYTRVVDVSRSVTHKHELWIWFPPSCAVMKAVLLWEPAYDIFVLRFRSKKQQFSVALPTPSLLRRLR